MTDLFSRLVLIQNKSVMFFFARKNFHVGDIKAIKDL